MKQKKIIILFIYVFLSIATIGVYWQVKDFKFVNYDDPVYVSENEHVKKGLSRDSIIWAFSRFNDVNWVPLSWLSLMLDFELYKLNPGGYHITNVIFHILNTLLLFLVFHRHSHDYWKSGFIAALFALHPMHVESVAWISERKDVLSGFFFMLTLWAYLFYTEKRTRSSYILVFFLFASGLMAKPMLVTLPFVLLLLDYWPLKRVALEQHIKTPEEKNGTLRAKGTFTFAYIIIEKVPFFILSAVSSIFTYTAQNSGGAVSLLKDLPLGDRIGNAVVAYVLYIFKTICPFNLAVIYPHMGMPHASVLILSVLFLVGITVYILSKIKSIPYLCTGWFWFIGMLVPVIGIVQVGSQSYADRYSYLPSIGLYIIIAWGLHDVCASLVHREKVLRMATIITVSLLTIVAWHQTNHWKNSITLFSHAVEVTHNNSLAYYSLGLEYFRMQRDSDAAACFQKALLINKKFAEPHFQLGNIAFTKGNCDGAIEQYRKAIRLKPDFIDAYNFKGIAFLCKGDYEMAVTQFQCALRIKPDHKRTYANLVNAVDLYQKHGRKGLPINCVFRMNRDETTP